MSDVESSAQKEALYMFVQLIDSCKDGWKPAERRRDI